MANYSEQEIRAFKLKDIMNCRMSALKAAATNNEGLGKTKEKIQEEADYYFKKLRQDQDVVQSDKYDKAREIEKEVTEKQLPEPTLAQKKVLDAISEKAFDGTMTIAIKTKVLNWAEEVHGQRSYPTKLDSVETFLKWYETL